MGLSLKSFGGGTIELVPVNTASNVTINVQAANGVLTCADSATGGLFLPVGETFQRPASPATGQIRFNTTTGSVEVYNGSSWG
jgi:hypothetical protein